jgi:hypothetical protein
MASLVLSGDTSGSITLAAPAVAGSTTQTLVNVTGTLAPIVSGTAVSASGTSVDFTGIPSWVKRITVMFQGVSTSGTSNLLVQIGSGSVSASNYASTATASTAVVNSTAGFIATSAIVATDVSSGQIFLSLIASNTWTSSGILSRNATGGNAVNMSAGLSPVLSGSLDRVRITTVNGTDTFDAGTINLLWE